MKKRLSCTKTGRTLATIILVSGTLGPLAAVAGQSTTALHLARAESDHSGGAGGSAGNKDGGSSGHSGSTAGDRDRSMDRDHVADRDQDRTMDRDQLHDQMQTHLQSMDQLRDRIHQTQDLTARQELMNRYRQQIQESIQLMNRAAPTAAGGGELRMQHMEQNQEMMQRMMQHMWQYQEWQSPKPQP